MVTLKMITADNLTHAQIWQVAAFAVRERDYRLLGYCDAAFRGGRRREKAARERIAAILDREQTPWKRRR